jgi:hypothetical protein
MVAKNNYFEPTMEPDPNQKTLVEIIRDIRASDLPHKPSSGAVDRFALWLCDLWKRREI